MGSATVQKFSEESKLSDKKRKQSPQVFFVQQHGYPFIVLVEQYGTGILWKKWFINNINKVL